MNRHSVRPEAGTLLALAASIAFSVLYLGVLGHLKPGVIDPGRLLPALFAAFVVCALGLLAWRRGTGGAAPADWARMPRRAAAVAFGLWTLAGAAVSALLVGVGAPRDALPHLAGAVTLLPAVVGGAVAFFLFEEAARTAAESGPPGVPGRPTRLRTRLVATLVTASAVPIALLAASLWHFQEHAGEAAAGEAHAPLLALVVVVGGSAGLAGVVFGVLAARSLIRPILALTSAMARVQAGDLGARAPLLSSDETGAAGVAFNAMVEGLAERAWLRETFGRYVSREVADALRAGRVAFQGEQRVATVLFADIRGFTRLSESIPAREVLAFVNEYLKSMTEALVRHHGRLDKVMGDGIMVVFGAPLDDPQHARNALRAALSMRQALSAFNAGRASAGKEPVRIGIGIHTGEVIAGNVGVDSHKVEYTVLGDTVNLASRIESMTKELGADVLATSATIEAAGEGVMAQPFPQTPIRGRSAPVQLFGVTGLRD